MSTRNISWDVKAARLRLPTLPTSCADCLEIREPQTPGSLRACPVFIETALPAFIFPTGKIFSSERPYSVHSDTHQD